MAAFQTHVAVTAFNPPGPGAKSPGVPAVCRVEFSLPLPQRTDPLLVPTGTLADPAVPAPARRLPACLCCCALYFLLTYRVIAAPAGVIISGNV